MKLNSTHELDARYGVALSFLLGAFVWGFFMRFIDRLKKFFSNEVDGNDIAGHPIIYEFPNLGEDGQISIDCIIRPAPGSDIYEALLDKNLGAGRHGVRSSCVGAILVEIDEQGLRFRWKPRKPTDDSFLSPFCRPSGFPPVTKPATEPSE